MTQRTRLTAYVRAELYARVTQEAGDNLTPSRMAEILLLEAIEARNQAQATSLPEAGRLQAGLNSDARKPSETEQPAPIVAR